MKISLWHRHYGCHEKIKETNICGNFENYYINENKINEKLLLSNIPSEFLPISHEMILLSVQTVNNEGKETGSTGQIGLQKFRNWSKYFDSYVLELERQ